MRGLKVLCELSAPSEDDALVFLIDLGEQGEEPRIRIDAVQHSQGQTLLTAEKARKLAKWLNLAAAQLDEGCKAYLPEVI